uniref:Uncharacterized protein n=1 Tax=Peronospora matthiolae TaxID=2874970 RepID=A0AAV1VMQ2_9STRA
MDADVDHTDADDDGAGIFSVANDCQSEDDDTLTGEDNVLSAVHTKRTAVKKDKSAQELLLTRETVVRSFKTLLQMQSLSGKVTQTNMEDRTFFR